MLQLNRAIFGSDRLLLVSFSLLLLFTVERLLVTV